MIVAGVGLFSAVAADLHYAGALARLDQPLIHQMHEHNTPAGVWLFSGLSYLGDLRCIALETALLLAWLWRKIGRRGWRSAAIIALGLAGSAVINQTLKQLWKIPRPEDWTFYVFDPGSGYSFPSGHTMGAGVMAGLIALVFMHHLPAPPRTRWLAGIAVAALTLLVGFALLYMGVHWLTDILGGFGATLAWVGVLRWLLPPARPSITPLKANP